MAVVEAAGDVIRGDRSEPTISRSFTDRLMAEINPQPEPRVARVIRFRRAAAFFGPILSAAAVWMIVVASIRPADPVAVSPDPVSMSSKSVEPRVAGVTEIATVPQGSATIGDALNGVLAPAWEAWRDTRRSTNDLAAVGRLLFSVAAESTGPMPSEASESGGETGVLLRAESMLMDALAPKGTDEIDTEGPDVL